jgi:DNA-binding MarR family transcriptional regulator
MKNDSMDGFPIVFKEKPVAMLLALLHSKKAVYVSTLAKQVKYTYSHVVKVLQDMEKAGLVSTEKHGRLKVIELTLKGKDIAEKIDELQRIM